MTIFNFSMNYPLKSMYFLMYTILRFGIKEIDLFLNNEILMFLKYFLKIMLLIIFFLSLSLHLFDRKISSMVLFYYIFKCLIIHVISKMNFQQSLLQSSPLKNKIDDPNLCLMYVFCLSYHRSSEEFGTVYSSLLCQQQISIAGSSSAWNDPAGLSFFS